MMNKNNVLKIASCVAMAAVIEFLLPGDKSVYGFIGAFIGCLIGEFVADNITKDDEDEE